MKLETIKEKTKDLLIFNKNYLKLLEKDSNNLNANIKYWLKNNNIISLKNGTYIFKDVYNKENNKDLYLEYIANQLLKPSYLSLEYVLAKYQIMSEPVRSLTSITLKGSRDFNNELGTWRYYQMPRELFTGFYFKSFKGQNIAVASKAKALFDFLYLRFRRGYIPNIENIKQLRLNLKNLSKSDKKEFFSYFKLISGNRWDTLKEIMKKIC
jgi:predicted transcriptional regulator of viral defense system